MERSSSDGLLFCGSVPLSIDGGLTTKTALGSVSSILLLSSALPSDTLVVVSSAVEVC